MKIHRIIIGIVVIILNSVNTSKGQKQMDMILLPKIEKTNKSSNISNFEIDEVVFERNSNYQKKKYGSENLKNFEIPTELRKWNSINSNDSVIFVYCPPSPDVPRRLLITNDAVITYFQDGMYSQIIREFEKINESKYKFKLCHNHSSPYEDGYIPATLTIINKEKGIAIWEEWRRKEEPISIFYIKNELIDQINLVKNKEGIMGNLEYSFDNELLKEMKNYR